MAYCRFFDTDAYIYEHVGGFLICDMCALAPQRSFTTQSRQGMLDHVAAHRAHGHDIPLAVDAALQQEIAQHGDIVEE